MKNSSICRFISISLLSLIVLYVFVTKDYPIIPLATGKDFTAKNQKDSQKFKTKSPVKINDNNDAIKTADLKTR
jgi:hypothetical protein